MSSASDEHQNSAELELQTNSMLKRYRFGLVTRIKFAPYFVTNLLTM
jgi:hypothetical protein